MKWYDLSLERVNGHVGVRMRVRALHPGLWLELYRVLRECGVGPLRAVCIVVSSVVGLLLKRK